MRQRTIVTLLLTLLPACTPDDKTDPEGTYDADCTNGVDDDGNGEVDCDDAGCTEHEACTDTGEADSDTDSDADSDSDGDTDTDSDADADCVPGARELGAGLYFRRICADGFEMGSPETEVGHHPDETLHHVTLTRDFLLGETPITQAQFESLLYYNDSQFTTCGDNCPVEMVSWHEAAYFTKTLSEAEGLEPCYECDGAGSTVICDFSKKWAKPYDCPGYRLPTEAEWEHAARAGRASAYFNGGNLLEADLNSCSSTVTLDNGALLADIAWFCGNSPSSTQPVGLKEANEWGLRDIAGNVWNWMGDGYVDYSTLDETDPFSSVGRSARGGAYPGCPYDERSARRNQGAATQRDPSVGFRIARTIPSK